MKPKAEKLILTTLIILIIISRFAFLDIRPLHNDEGVNYFLANEILERGLFTYSPLNYHGPIYFFMIAASFLIFGISEFSLRLPAVLFGIFIAIIPLISKRNEFNKYLCSFFLLISPSLLYYSRYSIHEIAFVFFSLVIICLITLIIEKKDLTYLPILSLMLALLFTTKETSIILLFIILTIVIFNFKKIKNLPFKENSGIVLLSIAIFLLIYTLLFSSFFHNLNGVSDSLKGFLPWIDRGLNEIGHDKPFPYYFLLILIYEWPVFLLALAGIVYSIKSHPKNTFAINLSIWFILNFAIYSTIPYKTPWLIINVIVPMCFLAAIGFKNLKIGKLKNIFLFAGISYILFFSFILNFVYSWQPENQFAYVHTDKDIIKLIEKVNEDYNANSSILIISKEYWPLPFYFNGKNISFFLEDSFTGYDKLQKYDFFIVRDAIFNRAAVPEGYAFEQYKLREGVGLFLVRRLRN